MRIGLKLELDFAERESYHRLLGGRAVPDRLAGLGVEAAELPVGPASDLEYAAQQAELCRRAGLRLSFHPYTEMDEANPTHFDGPRSTAAIVHERFLLLAAALSNKQGATVVNIHPAAAVTSDPETRDLLVERSAAFFSWAKRWCDENAPLVHPVAELQVAPDPGEKLVRIGDNPAELARIAKLSGVGVCWDVGHAEWNHRRFGMSRDPGPLWNQIAHVHCHDVNSGDHRPLRNGDAHWRRFLQRLMGTGYQGTVVIEVTAATFVEAGGLDALIESLAAVRSATVVGQEEL